jgi:hypothetical protein
MRKGTTHKFSDGSGSIRKGVTPGGRSYRTTSTKMDDGTKTKYTELHPTNSPKGRVATFSKYTKEDGSSEKRSYRKPIETKTSISARKVNKGPTKPLKRKK